MDFSSRGSGSVTGCVPCSASHAAFPPGYSEHNCKPQTSVLEPYLVVFTPFAFTALASPIISTDAAIPALSIIAVIKTTESTVLVIKRARFVW